MPILEKMMGWFGINYLIGQTSGILQQIGERYEEELDLLQEAMDTLAWALELFSIVTGAIQLLQETVQLLMSRSLKNVIDVIYEVVSLITELYYILTLPDDPAGPEGAMNSGPAFPMQVLLLPILIFAAQLGYIQRISAMGEKAVAFHLRTEMGYAVEMGFRNSINNGIDIVISRDRRPLSGEPLEHTTVAPVEVKTSGKQNVRVPKPSEGQTDADAFTKSRLYDIAQRRGRYRHVSKPTSISARRMLRRLRANGAVKGIFADVNLNLLDPQNEYIDIEFYHWTQDGVSSDSFYSFKVRTTDIDPF